MLVAKYTGIVAGSDTAIAHDEVYVARFGRKHRTKLNSDVSVELGWLDHVSGQASPHHHSELSHMWRMLSQQGFAPGARAPVSESRTDYRVLATRRKTHTAKSASGPAKTASEPQMPGRGLNQKKVTTMRRFCDIAGRNRPVLSLQCLLLLRAAVPGAGARPPRRAALALLPLVPAPHTHDAASFRNFAAPARTDDRRTMRRAVHRSG